MKRSFSKKRTTKRKIPAKVVTLPSTKFNKKMDTRFRGSNSYRVKPEPFPRVLNTRMKFSSSGNLNTGLIDTSSAYSFRANSIYDPDFTGIGRTVVGWAVMSNLYARYLVTGCKVVVTFNDPNIDGSRVGYRIRVQTGGATDLNSLQKLTEQPMTYISGINNTGSQKKSFSFFLRPWTMIGISKLEYFANTSKYSSNIAGNPVDPAYFDIFHINQTGAATINYNIRIVYYVQLYDRMYLNSTLLA